MTRIEAFIDLLERRRNMYLLGIDVGSVSTNLVLLDNNTIMCGKIICQNQGQAYGSSAIGFCRDSEKYDDRQIYSVGTTGSAE